MTIRPQRDNGNTQSKTTTYIPVNHGNHERKAVKCALSSLYYYFNAQSCAQLAPAKEVAYDLAEQRASLQAWPRLPGLFSLSESEGLEGLK